jgi:hypothetical protein
MIMMYRVIHGFTDLVDDGYVYQIGDTYPRAGYNPSDKRITELSSYTNRQKKPLIQPLNEKEAHPTTEVKKTRKKR